VPDRYNSSGSAVDAAVTLPHGCDGLSARRMAVLWTFHEPSLCRRVRRELLRNALLDFTPIIPATACHQRNYVETYSRCNNNVVFPSRWGKPPHPSLAWRAACLILASHMRCLYCPRFLGKTVWRAPVIIDTFWAWASCLSLRQSTPVFLCGFHLLAFYLLLTHCVAMSACVPLFFSPCSIPPSTSDSPPACYALRDVEKRRVF